MTRIRQPAPNRTAILLVVDSVDEARIAKFVNRLKDQETTVSVSTEMFNSEFYGNCGPVIYFP